MIQQFPIVSITNNLPTSANRRASLNKISREMGRARLAAEVVVSVDLDFREVTKIVKAEATCKKIVDNKLSKYAYSLELSASLAADTISAEEYFPPVSFIT